jgi:hypothetical protein
MKYRGLTTEYQGCLRVWALRRTVIRSFNPCSGKMHLRNSPTPVTKVEYGLVIIPRSGKAIIQITGWSRAESRWIL